MHMDLVMLCASMNFFEDDLSYKQIYMSEWDSFIGFIVFSKMVQIENFVC